MPRSKEENEQKDKISPNNFLATDPLQENFFSYEAFCMYGFLLTSTATGFALSMREDWGRIAKEHAYIWAPVVSTIFVGILGSWGNRFRETRDVFRAREFHRVEELIKRMSSAQEQGEKALSTMNFHLALTHFQEVICIFDKLYLEKLYIAHTEHGKKLYLDCMYKQAFVLYRLGRYVEAYATIEAVVSDESFQGDFHERVLLLNLRALIFIEESNLPENNLDKILPLRKLEEVSSRTLKDEQKEEMNDQALKAIEDLKLSFKLDSSQNSIFLLIHYLEKNYAFIVRNIPIALIERAIDLSSYFSSTLEETVFSICAAACVEKKEFSKAIYIYKGLLKSKQPNPNELFSLAQLSLNCFDAYMKLLDSHEIDESHFFGLLKRVEAENAPVKNPEDKEAENSEDDELKDEEPQNSEEFAQKDNGRFPKLIEKKVIKSDIISLARKKLALTIHYLEGELFLSDSPSVLARNYVNYGLLYLKIITCFEQLEQRQTSIDLGKDDPLHFWDKKSITRGVKTCVEKAEKLLVDDSFLRDIDLKNKLEKIINQIKASIPEILVSASLASSSSSSSSIQPTESDFSGNRYRVFNAIQVSEEGISESEIQSQGRSSSLSLRRGK